MVKIFLDGYWNGNLGDDLFMQVICDSFPECSFYALIPKNKESFFYGIKNLNIIQRNKLDVLLDKFQSRTEYHFSNLLDTKVMRYIKRADAYCELGGSIFILPDNGLGPAFYRRKTILNMGVPYFIIGSNFGPYHSLEQLNIYRMLLSKVNGVVFRDTYSFNLFKKYISSLKYAPDVVFNLNIEKYKNLSSSDYILISIIDPSMHYTEKKIIQAYFDYIKYIVESYIKKGQKVVLMSFCNAEGDFTAAKKIKELFKMKQEVQVYDHHNIGKSLQVLIHAKYIIGSRYHSMILGWLMSKPTFVLSYSSKVTHVINDYFPLQNYIKIEDLPKEEFKLPQYSVFKNLKEVRIRARQQFSYLHNFMKRQY